MTGNLTSESNLTSGKPGWFRALIVAVATGLVALFAGLSAAATVPPAAKAAAARPASGGSVPVIAVIGDSFSAGYGLSAGEGWVDLLQRKLGSEKYPHKVVNASISGDTTAGGAARIAGVLKTHAPAIVVIELGGNDGLRGGSLQAMKTNLIKMIDAARAAKARPLLVGIELPPNYGAQYTQRFAQVYAQVAKATGTPLVPSIVEGFGDRLDLFQADRVHPLPAAQPRMLDLVWVKLEPLLGKPRT